MQKTKLNYTFLGHYHLLGAIYYHVRFGNQDNFLPVFSILVFTALLPLHKYGVTIMCDSWTGPTGMSIINFMVYSNGCMFFHKSIDASGHKQSAGKCSCNLYLPFFLDFYC